MSIKLPTCEQQAVIDCPVNCVVTAKPGSGKTFTVVEKISKILDKLPDYKGVIAISFTNKASDELKSRCSKAGINLKSSFFGTIDKFCLSQIINSFAPHLTGKFVDYEIIDNSDGAEHNCHTSNVTYESFLDNHIHVSMIAEYAYYLLMHINAIITYLKARFTHIIIDEYQDCSEIQHKIFISLVQNGLIGIAVGDPEQAIFEFAGKSSKFIYSLIDNSTFYHFHLSKNHRCAKGIINYSECLINGHSSVELENFDNSVICVNVNGDYSEISRYIEQFIEPIKKKYNVLNNNQVAILCRFNNTINHLKQVLDIRFKTFEDTPLERDNSAHAQLFRSILRAYFSQEEFLADFVEEYYSKDYDPYYYKKMLFLCKTIFSTPIDSLNNLINCFAEIANLIFSSCASSKSINNLQAVLNSPNLLKSYASANSDEINIMSLHKSKGLEFNIVFLLDLYKYVFPRENLWGNFSSNDYNQELNLHYVGVTRAIDACYILLGTKRFSGDGRVIQAVPSPFLSLSDLQHLRRNIRWSCNMANNS